MHIVLPFLFSLVLQNVMNIFASVAFYEYLIISHGDIYLITRVSVHIAVIA